MSLYIPHKIQPAHYNCKFNGTTSKVYISQGLVFKRLRKNAHKIIDDLSSELKMLENAYTVKGLHTPEPYGIHNILIKDPFEEQEAYHDTLVMSLSSGKLMSELSNSHHLSYQINELFGDQIDIALNAGFDLFDVEPHNALYDAKNHSVNLIDLAGWEMT